MRHVTLALLVLSLAACCNLGNKKTSDESGTATSPTSAATTTAAPAKAREFSDRPAVLVDAKDILDEYKNNEVRADGKYKDKIVLIRGKVGDVKKDITDSIYVTVGSGAEFEIPEVQCFVKDSETKAAAALNKGDDVTIVGHVDGLLMNVLVKDCVINPDRALCEKVRNSVAPDAKCITKKSGTSVALADGTLIMPLCALTKEQFDRASTKAVNKTDNKGVTLKSEKSLCFAFVVSDKVVSPDLLTKVQTALDAL
ncbi:hypothetical protein [Polyangium sp. 6x1]|uniref:OB-fold protein n=1 Tax=Polyangium sp. 6x1 TaxID=3042689 RepID=UPI002482CB9A|nr:hypothetical protein [Polyangium sp. 6x1]MDI1448147.1 hypothetical protein [Polyangium sp. 6x1]